ncbi:EF-hand domain-containing protein [Bradyrhizobium sp. DASA03076]|uniref:EF-hand domain-containing protein n=1 Tax=Bradyrhizobium sp. BLXBL-03 TaxID=3395916 RepID=UPI003F6EFFA4
MLFALGAVSTALDAIQSLTSSKSSSTPQTGSSQGAANPFVIDSSTSSTSSNAAPSANPGHYPQISPETMNALFAAQSQSTDQSASTGNATSTSRDAALKDLFSQIDANGDGKITQSEFENALGAGGTNLAQADDVFSKLDTNSDGGVSLDEMSKALKGAGHHGGHHHAHAPSGSGGASGNGSDSSSSPSGGSTSTTTTAADGSTTTTVTYADGFKMTTVVPGASSANSPYDWFGQMMQRQAQTAAGSAASSMSMSV